MSDMMGLPRDWVEAERAAASAGRGIKPSAARIVEPATPQSEPRRPEYPMGGSYGPVDPDNPRWPVGDGAADAVDAVERAALVFAAAAQGAGATVLYPPGRPWRLELDETQLHAAIRVLLDKVLVTA